ncbi:hypothetical protein M2158_005794 [Streptomyces sp. SAI-144]|nr:hypothetical protein [Streptomyces sp. SAI-144]
MAEEPVDLTDVPVGLADLRAGPIAQQMRGGDHVVALLGDEGDAFTHPRVGDELVGLPLQGAEHRVRRD